MRGRALTAADWAVLATTTLAGPVVLIGCAPMETEAPTSLRSPIVFGYESGPGDDSVVLVQAKELSGVTNNCSGTMVAPNLLLTARHCVSSYIDGVFTCSPEGELEDAVGRAGAMGDLVPPEGIKVRAGRVPASEEVARGIETFALATPSICRNDIALVVLDRNTDLPVSPLRLTTAVRHDEPMRPVGYGLDEDGGILERRTRDDVPVTVIGPSEYWPEAGFAPPRTFAIGPSACQGDSGGPALTERDAVAGVYSLSAGTCTSSTVRNYFTQVAPFEDLVREAFQEAGAEILLETGIEAAGAAGAAAAGASAGHVTPGNAGASGSGGAPVAGRAGTAGSAGANESSASAGANGSTPSKQEAGAGGSAGIAAGPRVSADAGSAGLAGDPDQQGSAGRIAMAGDAGSDAASNYHGPRKKGGCRCGVVGAGTHGSGLSVFALIAAFGAVATARIGRSRERRPGRGRG